MEWIYSPDGARRWLRVEYTEIGGEFEWLDENGERTYTMMQTVLYRPHSR